MTKRKKSNDILPEIPCGERPRVLLVGNGVNLSFMGAQDTDSIIKKEWKAYHGTELPDRPKKKEKKEPHPFWTLPFPMQVVVATNDHVQHCMSDLAVYFRNMDIEVKQVYFIREVLDHGFDAVLTTNYSLEFERSTIEQCSKGRIYQRYRTTADQTEQQEQFSLYRCTELPYANNPLLWHIHGTALRKDSMVMGQLFYGKLMSEVATIAKSVSAVYKSTIATNTSYKPKSWVDYFLIGDVYIFGLDLAFSEIDLWWLLSYKKSMFPESRVYYHKPDIEPEKKLVMECYQVEMPEIEFDNYVGYYKRVCDSIK